MNPSTKVTSKDFYTSTLTIAKTIVWFPEDTCTTFQVAKIHARIIKFHQKYFVESIPYEDIVIIELE